MTAAPAAHRSVADALRRAVASYEAGRLAEAEPGLRAILEAAPGHFDALHLLGVIRARRGDHDGAAALLARAIAVDPRNAEAHHNLGNVQRRLRRIGDAAGSYARATALAPDNVDAHYRLGMALDELGRTGEALASFRTVVGLRPGHVGGHFRTGIALFELGCFDEAAGSLQQAIALKPDFAAAHNNLGAVLNRLDRPDAAIASFRRALELAPDDAGAHNNLGATLDDLGRHEEAAESYERAIAIRPDHADAHRNLGLNLARRRRFGDAVGFYRRAIELKPGDAQAHLDLGAAYIELRRLEHAEDSHRRAVALAPDRADAHYGLSLALAARKRYPPALASCRRALELRPGLPGALSHAVRLAHRMCDWTGIEAMQAALVAAAGRLTTGVFPLLSVTDDPAVMLRAASRFCADRVEKARPDLWRGGRSAHDRIRLAYMSTDFREHATSYLAAGLFECHDRSRFEIHAVSLGPDDDSAMRRRLRLAFGDFIDAGPLSDRDAASEIRRREIDILVDLNGHTRGSRPGIAAMRPAPVQVNWLGYPGTMGADFIDYMIVDPFVAPAAHQPFYAERLVHLPDCYQVNDRGRVIAAEVPSRSGCGLPPQGFVFCSFNNPYKIAPAMFDVWMRLLRDVPGSVLWLLADNEWVGENLRREARHRGVDADRLVFAPRRKLAEHLARHRLADLFLDTLPCNAHTTASDALWAGLPVLTCAGQGLAARVAGSLLRAVGLPELVTHSLADYEALALRLATRPEELAAIGSRLAANRLTTKLFDTDRFRRHIEAAYARMWAIHQRGEPPRAFAVEPM